ncbi:MAG TPA: hypothetical protein VFG62_21365 [Rhodopila sp.]|nr:hypothetical protein [Rhodopila sp.]
MQLPRTIVPAPTGLAFDVPDLLMLHAWAEYHELRMTIDLDTFAGSDEYEEIVNLSETGTPHHRWMIWRSADGIVVQPRMGRPMLFDMMADALDLLIPTAD